MGQLHHLEANNECRAKLAGLYFQRLALTDFILPPADFEKSNWHMFQMLLTQELAKQRPVLIRFFKSRYRLKRTLSCNSYFLTVSLIRLAIQ